MDNAPTRLNARAMFEPMMSITTLVVIAIRNIVTRNDCE